MTDHRPRIEDAELALAIFLGRPGRVLNSRDYQDNQVEQMRTAIAAVVDLSLERAYERGYEAAERLTTQGRGLGELLSDNTPSDLRADPDLRVDAAYQRGFAAGRAAEVRADLPPVESSLGVQVDEEMRTEQLATLRAQRRHAEVAAEQGLDTADLARRTVDSITAETTAAEADRERRRAIDQDRLPSTYVIRRDAIFAAIAHADAFARAGASVAAIEGVGREKIMDAVPWWEAQFGDAAATPSVGEPAGATSAIAIEFAAQLLDASGAQRNVDSIHDSTTPGAFRVILTDDTVLDVVVSEAPAGQ